MLQLIVLFSLFTISTNAQTNEPFNCKSALGARTLAKAKGILEAKSGSRFETESAKSRSQGIKTDYSTEAVRYKLAQKVDCDKMAIDSFKKEHIDGVARCNKDNVELVNEKKSMNDLVQEMTTKNPACKKETESVVNIWSKNSNKIYDVMEQKPSDEKICETLVQMHNESQKSLGKVYECEEKSQKSQVKKGGGSGSDGCEIADADGFCPGAKRPIETVSKDVHTDIETPKSSSSSK